MMVRAIFVTKTDLVSNGLLTVLRSGVWVPLLVMLPNLVWMALLKKPAGKRNPVPLWLTIVENVGRVAVLTIPFFMFWILTNLSHHWCRCAWDWRFLSTTPPGYVSFWADDCRS